MLLARKIIEIPAMKSYVRREVLPGPDVNSDEEMLEYIRGVDRLRVADASVMPTVVSGNTNATCVVIGEKAADMVLQDAR